MSTLSFLSLSLMLEMTLSGALLIMVIALIRVLGMHKLPKRAFMVLWCIALFQLTIPFSIPSQASIFNLFGAASHIQPSVQGLFATSGTDTVNVEMPGFLGQIQGDLSIITIAGEELAVPYEADGSRLSAVSSLTLVYLVYLTGLALSVALFILLYNKNRKDFSTALPISNKFIDNWLAEHQPQNLFVRPISIRVSDKIAAPLTYGILRPVILLPKNTDWSNEGELNFVLAHEFVHIKRFDALTKLLMTAALCVHWFNPIVWGMYILFNRDVEISCDEAVVNMLGEKSKQDYALTLISMIERKRHLPVLYNNFSKYAIEERITIIMAMKKRTIIGTMAAFLVVGATATVFATSRPDDNEIANEYLSGYQSDDVLTDTQVSEYPSVPPIDGEEASDSASVSPLLTDLQDSMSSQNEGQNQGRNQSQFQWPAGEYMRIAAPFGLMINPLSGREEFHTGIDIPAPEGAPIFAAGDGYVLSQVWGHDHLGYAILIDHGGAYSTLYAHAFAIHVEEGQFVRQGDHIADVGSTGEAIGPHLHFEIRIDNIAIDPLVYFIGEAESQAMRDEWAVRAGDASLREAVPLKIREDFPVYVIEYTERNIRFALAHIYYDEGYPVLSDFYLSFDVAARLVADAIYQEFDICIDGMAGNMFFVERMYDDSWIGNIHCEESTPHSPGDELFHFVIDAVTGEVLSLYMNTEETPFR